LEQRAAGVFAGLQQRWLKLGQPAQFDLDQAAKAHRHLVSRRTTGKLALVPGR